MARREAPPRALAARVEGIGALDAVAKRLGKAVRNGIGPGPLRDALAGRWLGHSVHPLLTDTVIGTWTSALLLDLAGRDEDDGAAQRLIGAGIAAYLPTAATGLLDWADSEATDDGIRRAGAVHAASNGVGFALQAASLAARRRGDHARGKALSLMSFGALTVGGYLGAHLSFARGVGVEQTVFDPGSDEWARAAASDELAEAEPKAVVVGDTPVLLVRRGGTLRAIHDRCSHRGCSLAEGKLDGDVIECGCHGSRFRLADGGIERGPASGPQPAFDVRERDGSVEVRRRLPA